MGRRGAGAVRRRLAASALLALAAAAAFRRCLPAPLFDAPFSPVLLGRDGTLLDARIAADGQWRFPPSAARAPKLEEALLHFEDKRFYSHRGVDPLALLRAARQRAETGRFVSGGSTLTMQVIRLSRKDRPRTLREKLIEAVLAARLEMSLSKREILALYFTHAPYGGNVVGVETAGWRYFGRPPERLSWAESALLAVLPNSPALVHPGRRRGALKEKRDRLLASLAEAGKLSPLELKLAALEPLPDAPRPFPELAPHLLDTLASGAGGRVRSFRTTLEPSAQRAAVAVVERRSEALALHGIRNAAALVVDNRDRSVIAYVGNSRRTDFRESGFAVDVARRPRSTGSLLKPFLYAAALESGETTPATLIPDVPTQYLGFAPENYDRTFRGAVPAREALARSLNVPAVRMLWAHGVARFRALLKGAGMTTLWRDADGYGLTLILGGAEGTLWDLTRMYANLAWIAGSTAEPGKTPYRELRLLAGDPETLRTPVEFGPGAAWLTLQALMEVSRPDEEAHWRNFSSAQRVAWKTGTSLGHRDGWAIGTNGRYTVGVWTGNAAGDGRPELTGSASAAPILFELLGRLGPGEWAKKPSWDLKEIEVCESDGFLPSEGCRTVKQAVPFTARFERPSPHFRLVHLDPTGRWRVNDGCESVLRMRHEVRFALPPAQESYYRRRAPEYRPLPPLRADCRETGGSERGPIAFLYPHEGSRIYIPVDLGEKRGKVVFEAVHSRSEALLHWHVDGTYKGKTEAFHQLALDLPPGEHRVTIVDEQGRSASRRFTILEKDTVAQR
ncbi:MAG: penicillin-binding protein 1C [Elusimicrobia bacterium]|nr:penicillin-binding protein 1C [Elusimicrobiota bacterium]